MVKNNITTLITLFPDRSKVQNHQTMHDETQQLTEPDLTASLYQMVQTGIVSGGSKNYTYGPDLDDDELHDGEDFSKVTKKDPVIMQEIIDSNLFKPETDKPEKDGTITKEPEGTGDNTGTE